MFYINSVSNMKEKKKKKSEQEHMLIKLFMPIYILIQPM